MSGKAPLRSSSPNFVPIRTRNSIRADSKSRESSPFRSKLLTAANSNSNRDQSPLRSISRLTRHSSRSVSPRRFNVLTGSRDDLPILEDDEDEVDEVSNRPILPIFDKGTREPSPKEEIELRGRERIRSHTDQASINKESKSRSRVTSQERIARIQKEIEGDFDKEFYADTVPVFHSRSKNEIISETQKEIFGESSQGETTDDEASDYDNNASNYYESYPLGNISQNQVQEGSSTNVAYENVFGDSNYIDGDEYTRISTEQINEVMNQNDTSLASRLIKFGTGGLRPVAKTGSPKKTPTDEEYLLENEMSMDQAKELVKNHVENLGPVEDHLNNSHKDLLPLQFSEFDELQNNSDISLPSKVRPGVTSGILQLYDIANDMSDILYSEDDVGNTSSDSLDKHKSSNLKHKLKKKLNIYPNNHNQPGSQQNLLSPRNSRDSIISNSRPLHRRSLSTGSIAGVFRPKISRNSSAGSFELPSFVKKEKIIRKAKKKKRKRRNTARITIHIADILQRQKFVLTLCKALMMYGAPNHRLEEYLGQTARVLEIDASFIYLPGCMLVSFGDPSTRTSEVRLVRVAQGLDLGKLDEAHDLYKRVVHDRIGVEEAEKELESLLNRLPYFNNFWIVVFYGLSSAFVIIWFGGKWLDMIPSFVLGCLLGFMQFYVAPRSKIYSTVFEVTSAVWLSFFGRAIGSIKSGKYFCYGAITQAGLCMLLPGYLILSGALEIQSRSLISGSVRMFYAIIYSLFLGFGLTLGAALYGWMDKDATTVTTCTSDMSPYWNIFFIPFFTVFMSLACQAQWHQVSIMTIIACSGYVVYYFSAANFYFPEFNAALGAFTVGLLSNIYSRTGKSFTKLGYCNSAFTSMLSGVFDLVPGGVASRNVLKAGIDQLNKVQNGTYSSTSIVADSTFSFGFTMIEVAIGISVGLLLSTLVVYPFGKKKTGLFSL